MIVSCADKAGPVWRVLLAPDDDGGEVAITAAGIEQFLDLLDEAARAPRCRALVLEGSGGCFCRGMSLEEVAAGADTDLGSRRYAACLRHLRGSGKAVIAAVDGEAIAGGVGLVAAADIAIATERSSFALPELMLGLLPAMVLPLLQERMPAQKARRLAMSTGSVDAARALEHGLIDRLVRDEAQLERAVRAELKAVLRLHPTALADLKHHGGRLARADCSVGIDMGADYTVQRLADPRVVDDIRAFIVDGTPPPWFERYRPAKDS